MSKPWLLRLAKTLGFLRIQPGIRRDDAPMLERAASASERGAKIMLITGQWMSPHRETCRAFTSTAHRSPSKLELQYHAARLAELEALPDVGCYGK